MLVLSRKKDQRVTLPGLNVTIQVMRCSESTVKLGFDAPPEVRIIRDELEYDPSLHQDQTTLSQLMEESIQCLPEGAQHEMRNKFNVLTIALHVIRDEIDAGELIDSDAAYEKLLSLLTASKGSSTTTTPDVSGEVSVLVVEDQENEREMLAGILRMNGYDVATAKDGVEALEYLQEHSPPSFVLVDMHMPRCDGASVVRQIRDKAELSDTRVYVVSGSAKEDTQLASSQVDSWHVKPVDPRQLIDSMKVAGGSMTPA